MPPPPAKPVAGLKKKLGPLPVYAWALLGIGAAVLGYWFLKGRGSGGADAPVDRVVGANNMPPEDLAFAGGPTGNTPPAQGLSADVLDALGSKLGEIRDFQSYALGWTGEQFGGQGGRFDALGQRIDDLAGMNDTTSLQAAIADLPSVVADAIAAVLGPPETTTPTATTPVTKKPARPQGVKWGGHTFTTKAQMSNWLKNRGSSYAVWAQRHPEAAKTLRGPLPKAKPRPRPATRPVPTPRHAARTGGNVSRAAKPKLKPKPKPSVRPQTGTRYRGQ